MRSKLIRLCQMVLDGIYPRRCAICDRAIKGDDGICRWCEPKVEYLEGPLCMKCGKRLQHEGVMFCYDCKRTIKSYERGFAVFEYEYIKDSLYRFKYSGRAEYSRFYAMKAGKRLKEIFERIGVEVFIPVPIHSKRYRRRGYNQAEEFAKELTKVTGIETRSDLVMRNANTVPLKRLSASERQKNLEKAFKLNKNDVKFRKVCIVDDIYTTGATIDSIATLLKKHGVREVYFVTIAIGRGV